MTRNLRNLAKAATISFGLIGLSAFGMPANALMVVPQTNPNEPSIYSIMDNLYGAGNWTQWDDTHPSYQNVTNGGQTYQVTFQSRYAQDPANFGVLKNQTSYIPLMTMGPNNGGAVPTTVYITPSMQSDQVGGLFAFGFTNTATGDFFSSNKTQNADGLDHLIVFALNSDPASFVLAWKDMYGGGDFDYNDAVFQVSWKVVNSVPEPATLLLFSAACLGVGVVTRRRKI